jgi:Domain of unknown function (DUF4333)
MRIPTLLRLTATATGVGLSAGFVVATAAGAGTSEVSKATVQTQAAKILASETGQKLPKVACSSGVAAKVGAVIHCTVVPHGMTIKYPVTITVRSIQGSTAHFYVQVGQAPGQANRTKFCADNAIITKALTAATTESVFLSAVQANEQTILDLQSSAPSKVVANAGTLVEAARQAMQSGNAAIFNTKAVAKAAIAIDSYCGQSTGG